MDRFVEKLPYSRRDTAEALSLSIRSIDYLMTTGRLTARVSSMQNLAKNAATTPADPRFLSAKSGRWNNENRLITSLRVL
jgi:hypothetical protein